MRNYSLLLVVSLLALTGCGAIHNAIGPDRAESELRDAVEAPVTLSGAESPFCAVPVVSEPSLAPAVAAIPPAPYEATLYFILDTDELTPESKIEARNIYNEIISRQIAEAIVVGHTDTSASHAYNQTLSLERANKVRQDLIDIGVPANIIRTSGVGETDLLIETADGVREPRNRRVKIDVR